MEYPRSSTDIYHVAFLLRQRLCADLVPLILDEAQYWTRRSVSLDRAVTVSDAAEGKRILRTQPLSAAEHRRVRAVRFHTRSVAQCFDRSIWDRPQSPSCGNCDKQLEAHPDCSSSPSDSDSPSESSPESEKAPSAVDLARAAGRPVDAKADKNKDEAFTWFEAHVTHEHAPDHLYPDSTSRHEGAMRAGAPREPGCAPELGPRLIGNCNTEEELCHYETEWRFDAPGPDRKEMRMVRDMRCGDVVDFTAHCSVYGWENFVKSAEVEMFFGYIR